MASPIQSRPNGGDPDWLSKLSLPSSDPTLRSEQFCLVTGGRGFVGRHLVKKLLEKEWTVRIFDLAPQLVLSEEEKLGILGTAVLQGRVVFINGDLCNKEHIIQAVQGVSAVFHMAAPNPRINDFRLHCEVNVEGTQNVIDACVEAGVKKLIYTSSASVVFDGIHDIKNGDESLPYPEKPLDAYSSTKSQAEQLVLQANGRNGLLTICLRPSAVFGPGDNVFLPTIVAMARAGRMKFIIGSGENEMDFTYVENVVHAHLCAEAALVPSKADDDYDNPSGKVYFITNGEPHRFWDIVFEILTSLGYDSPKGSLPLSAVLLMAQGNELFRKALAPLGVPLGDFSPSRVKHTTTWRTFYCSRAAKLLGYAPIIPLKEGLRRTVEAYPHLRAENAPEMARDFSASKVHAKLGGGKVADVLLWRDAMQTTIVFSFAAVLFYLLFMSKFTLVSLFADAAILFSSICALYGFSNKVLGSFGYELWDIPPVEALEFREESTRAIATRIASSVNALSPLLTVLLRGRSPKVTMKAIVFFWLLAKVGRFALRAQLGVLMFLAFSIPVMYDRNEETVEKLAVMAKHRALEVKEQTLSKFPPAVQSKLLSLKSKKRL